MQPMLCIRRAAAVLMLGALVSCGTSFEPGVALAGHWGGQGLILDLTPTGGTMDGGCWSGVLNAPLIPDQMGVVGASGYSISVGGAPPPPGYVPQQWPVYVSGLVDGDHLQVSVRALGVDYVDRPPRYEVMRGAPGNVLRCP